MVSEQEPPKDKKQAITDSDLYKEPPQCQLYSRPITAIVSLLMADIEDFASPANGWSPYDNKRPLQATLPVANDDDDHQGDEEHQTCGRRANDQRQFFLEAALVFGCEEEEDGSWISKAK